jgi:O-acetylserine/cysteine efflux transporter
MRLLDFLILMLCCLAWGGNLVASAWALGTNPVPPFLLAAIRASIVLLITGVYLFRPLPKKFGLLLCVSFCVGSLHLAFLYTGLGTASATASSIISQMLIPMATILSVFLLKEKIGRVRGIAIFAAFLGGCIMIYEPGNVSFDIGLIYVLLAYVALALGSVLVKLIGEIDWKVYVAWTAIVVLTSSTTLSFLLETDQISVVKLNAMPLFITAGYAALAVSIFAHGQYFRLLTKYDVSVVVPLTLMTTVFATLLGILLLGDTLYPRYILGGAIILPSVYIIARRQKSNKTAPELMEV